MFNQFNPQINIDRLKKQKEEIENLISNYQQMPPPINNIINQSQTPQNNLVDWRVLNENEQVDNLYVTTKTLFINDKNMIVKGVDGNLEKWEVKKIYPIDKKDERINQLEEEIKKLKETIYEYSKPNEPTNECFQSNDNDDGNAKPKSKTSIKSIQPEE